MLSERSWFYLVAALLAVVTSAVAGSREILLDPGVVWLDEPLVVDTAKSGCVIRSRDPAHPTVLSGGRRIGGWKVGSDGAWRTFLPDVKEGRWNFSALYVNGCRRFRPRLPVNGFYLTHANAFVDSRGIGGFTFRRDDINEKWSNCDDIEFVILHNWAVTRTRISGIDKGKRLVTLKSPRAKNYMQADDFTSRRYRVENVKEAFGRPGEWYLDRPSGILSYMPLPGERPETTEVVAPRLDFLVQIKGANDVTFRDVVFAHQNIVTPDGGYFAYQSAYSLPAAVRVSYSGNIRFERCAFVRTDGYGLSFGDGCVGCGVFDGVFRDLGGGGVKIGAFSGSPSGKRLSLSNVVSNCRISNGGRRHPDGVAVLVGKSSFNRIIHNDISDFYYSGISCGWDWNAGKSNAHHNEIGFNHVHDIGQHVLSDLGLVYLLGRAPGTTVHDNDLHDIRSASYGGTGIYLDNGSSEVRVWNNFVCGTVRSLHQNYGEDCHVWNNVFVDGSENQWDYRPRYRFSGLNLSLTRNIFAWRSGSFMYRGKPFDMPEGKYREWNPPYWQGVASDSNVYWCCTGTAPMFGTMSVDDWRRDSGNDRNSVFGDPLFSGDVRKGTCLLRPESPALKLGFSPIDRSKAGLLDASRLPPIRDWEACTPYADVTGGVWTASSYDTWLSCPDAKLAVDHAGWSTRLFSRDGVLLVEGHVPFVRPIVKNGNCLCSTYMEQREPDVWRWEYGTSGCIDLKIVPFRSGWVIEIVHVEVPNVQKLAVGWLRGVKVAKTVDKATGTVTDGKYGIVVRGYGAGASLHLGEDCLAYLLPAPGGGFSGLKAGVGVIRSPDILPESVLKEMDAAAGGAQKNGGVCPR